SCVCLVTFFTHGTKDMPAIIEEIHKIKISELGKSQPQSAEGTGDQNDNFVLPTDCLDWIPMWYSGKEVPNVKACRAKEESDELAGHLDIIVLATSFRWTYVSTKTVIDFTGMEESLFTRTR
ncbi:hypothetical protein ACJX0J_016294, partial [Zea mays]